MNELDDIKMRAAELDKVDGSGSCMGYAELLDKAIAGWEGTQQAFNLMMDERVNVSTASERMAIAAALALRDAAKCVKTDAHLAGLAGLTAMTAVLADTAWPMTRYPVGEVVGSRTPRPFRLSLLGQAVTSKDESTAGQR